MLSKGGTFLLLFLLITPILCTDTIVPLVSVILGVEQPSFIYLRQALRSLQDVYGLSREKDPFEVLVVCVSGRNNYERAEALASILASNKGSFPISMIADETHGLTLSQAFNEGAQKAKGDYLVFVEDFVELTGPDTLLSLIKTLKEPNVGVVGGKVIFEDETVYHVGVDFALQTNPEAPQWNYDSSKHPEIPALHHRVQGYPWRVSKAMEKAEVPVVNKALLGITKSVFFEVGGFNSSYSSTYFDADLCLRVSQQLKKKVVFTPDSISLYNDKKRAEEEYTIFGNEENKKDAMLFNSRWGNYVRDLVKSKHTIKNVTLIWNMECTSGQALGFTTEALSFMMSLYDKVSLKLEVQQDLACKQELSKMGLPLSIRNTAIRSLDRLISTNENSITVLHKDPGRYLASNQRPLEYVIGRSMYETNKIPSEWVSHCNGWQIDKIWVPTRFNLETFFNSTVNITKLDVVPEPVDVVLFDPLIHNPLLPTSDVDGIFKFLSIHKWEKRKGWNVLLRAYFDEFKGKDADRVKLYIVSRQDENNKKEYNKFIDSYLNETGITHSELPNVEILNIFLPLSKFPSLYKSANCFVLASHGEGWGLPLAEAMSMGIPTISTYWSGATAFMTKDNSFPVDIDGLEPAEKEGHLWAKPSLESLKKNMRKVFEGGVEITTIANRGRSDMVKKFSHDAVGRLIANKLDPILPILSSNKEMKRSKKSADDKNTRPTVSNSWWQTNPNGWASGWSSATPTGTEFVDEVTGTKKWKIKIINE